MEQEDLIKKWLDSDLSEEDTKAFDALKDADLYKEIVNEAKRFDGSIGSKVASIDALNSRLKSKNSPSLNWVHIALRIAAVFVIGIAVFTLLDSDDIIAFDTDYAQKESITLPDNSIVTLNEQSQLKYNSSNWDSHRALELKGEAFFNVEKGNRFDVTTKFGDVRVLGTTFNVLSRDSIFKVSCYEGRVAVFYGNENIELLAGTEFILQFGNATKTPIAVAEPYWMKQMSVFENASIHTVFKALEDQFDITIRKDYNNQEVLFTGAFEHDTLENALKSVTQPLNLVYEITTNNVVIIRHEHN